MSLLCRGPTVSLSGSGVTGFSPVSESYKASTSCQRSPKYSQKLQFYLPVLLVLVPAFFLLLCLVDHAAADDAAADIPEILLSCLDPLPALMCREGERRARAASGAAPSERVSVRVAPAVASGSRLGVVGRGHVRKGRGGQLKDLVCVPFC